MERLVVLFLAILVAAIIFVGSIATVNDVVTMFINEHRVVLMLVAGFVAIVTCVVIRWRTRLDAAPR